MLQSNRLVSERAFYLLFFIVLIVVMTVSSARSQTAQKAGCKLETLGAGVVRRVIDGRGFQLEDGQHVRLAAIEAPRLPPASKSEPQSSPGFAAKSTLEALLAGQTVTLQKFGPDTDRYGRIVALVTVTGQQHSVQHDMLTRGYARVAAEMGPPACTATLLAAEQAARSGSLGLWSGPAFVIRPADNPAVVLAERGRFTLVEGRVLSVRESRGTIYVNFGRRWTEDFTVTILKRSERSFIAAGIEPNKLSGRRVRTRGFIEERGGPWIEAARPEQIELLE
jgi:endonuclease YncB( thermonuclease family)